METLHVHLSAMFLVVVMLTGSLSGRTAQRESGATILIDSDDTSGVVRGPKGPEAGSPRTNGAQCGIQGHVARVRTLVDEGSDVNARDNQGAVPLHYAAQMGRLAIMEILISRGADVNLSTLKDGTSPIHLASVNGQLEAVRLLTKHGADVNKANQYRVTPLHLPLSAATQQS